jgi:hypothetical protein
MDMIIMRKRSANGGSILIENLRRCILLLSYGSERELDWAVNPFSTNYLPLQIRRRKLFLLVMLSMS